MNHPMKRVWPALWLLLALALAACGGGDSAAGPGELAAATADAATATAAALPATSPPTAGAPVATVPPDTPLRGPVVGFNLEDTSEQYYLSVFDAGTGALREFHNDAAPISPYEARWFADGCLVYANGHLLDLHGELVWSVPDEAAAQVSEPRSTLLSPDRAWLANVVEGEGAAGLQVEAIRLTAPFDAVRLSERGGGSASALLWRAAGDGLWLYFSDYDAGGVLQVYRARPDGADRQPLTAHNASPALIDALALSPDGRLLAYAARNVVAPLRPYTYQAADEAWVGIVEMATGAARRVALPKLGAVEAGQGLVWSADSRRLLVIGDSLPVAIDDPLAGRQVHWLAADGTVERSFHQADAPGAQLGWVSPLGDIDSLMFSSNADIYRYDAGQVRRLEGVERPPIGEMGRRTVGMLPATLAFAGEAACQP